MTIDHRIEALIELSLNPTFIIDKEAEIVLSSEPKLLALEGGGPSNLSNILGCHDAAQSLLEALRDEKTLQFEAPLLPNELKIEYAIISICPIKHADPTVFSVQFTNITAQRKREAEVSAKEALWRSALTTSGTGVWEQRVDDNTVNCCDIWRNIRGISRDEVILTQVEDWVQYVHPDDRARVQHFVERQNAGDPFYTVLTYRIKHPNGQWVWIESRGSCVERDEFGRPTRIVGTDHDVTDWMETKLELEHLSRRLKLALDVSQIGVFEADITKGTTNWDKRTYEIFNIDPSTPIVIGDTWEKLIHPDDLEEILAGLHKSIATLKPYSGDYRAILPDGRLAYLRARNLPYMASDGTMRIIGTTLDVTSDVKLRNELERSKSLAEARNSELENARISIEHNALHDYLTDLPNRRYLDIQLEKMAQHCQASNCNMAILHIDLDRFKQINDTLGHYAGDVMLVHAAHILKDAQKEGDFVARIGGDEFVFVSHFKKSLRKINQLAEHLIEEMRKPYEFDGHECRFGASIGIAATSAIPVDAKQLLLNADIALYNAKKRGRNRYEFFSQSKQNWLVNTKKVSDGIWAALERNEFVPFYQLQFDAKTLEISGVETLARWDHPVEGILTPDHFIDVAEDLNVMADIDALILEKALHDFHKWQARGINIPKLSVNVSTRRLYDPNLVKSLSGLNFEPGRLAFELLESIFLDDRDDIVVSNLKQLRKMGIDIEVDDFGTGHASIISVLQVEPSTLKVDRALIQHAVSSVEQRKLLSAIIDLGHSQGIKVLAEGVEETDQICILRELGCDELQGFALCRPMSAAQLPSFIAKQSWQKQRS